MDSQQQERHFSLARASLQQALAWYGNTRRHWHYPPDPELKAAVHPELHKLQQAIAKLDSQLLRISTFGLVSRGKSAVINALLGNKILETGPLHGVTQYPRTIRWDLPTDKLKIDLIDTPGLDEIEGEMRSKMAADVAAESDLILFIVAGDITRTEYEALHELRQQQKPILVVFNKIDLYPDCDRQAIFQQLQQLGRETNDTTLPLTTDEIVMVAAEPQAIALRIEHPDGSIEETWETPDAQIDPLREKIFQILSQEGKSLMAIHALVQARHLQQTIADKTLDHRQQEAEDLIWTYAKYKATAIALNPIGVIDVFAGTFTDLALIRALARLYGLPMTSHEATKLWRNILMSAGILFAMELGSGFFVGLGRTAGLGAITLNPSVIGVYGTAALAQGGIAAYGCYIIGKVTKTYLQQGCSWGNLGASTTIREILKQCDHRTLLYRLQSEISLTP
ncbi:small GTP-binding protein [[Leptolyngbya] sp. PCC 7376]|uniref:GTP-binding protein n=1 Tax=[Leptolyngbya] sp. PCC 7376 TaxID=111781 RepID=UPI00029EF05D|nr:GTP-binding protein [[Leptolyngbya] sp. PCC 7376]AFY37019.1 small GTP-binding protein [[Leptolyngbya] sp. PCC 7376]